jgi:hypothetical protein
MPYPNLPCAERHTYKATINPRWVARHLIHSNSLLKAAGSIATMTDTQKKNADLKEVETVEDSMETYARIMATQKPNPMGPGYIKLYLLSAVVFLCSTMNGLFPVPAT